MEAALFLMGVAVGLAMAAPVGPVNLLVVREALRAGFGPAFLVGLASVAADAMYALVAAFGVSAVANAIEEYERPLLAAGGLLLVVMGVRLARARTVVAAGQGQALPTTVATARKMLAAFMLTLTNPGVLFGFAAIFATLNSMLQLHVDPLRPVVLVAGVMAGDALWWLFLSSTVARYRSRIGDTALGRINRWTGLLIAVFGFLLLFEAAG
ncbi:LysE family translocator [Aestuariivirga sp.]|jgi:threonine/homoserine/homoserine lactone efflux protein|uniref:LysE family translocator n=1 Tax=Aestuariivirga sp. TaxID=2650926 RepID=UPI00378332C8